MLNGSPNMKEAVCSNIAFQSIFVQEFLGSGEFNICP